MFAVFNRFDGRYEEAARDLGATPRQTFRHVVLPLIAPSLIGIGLFGFTLSWDEAARSSQAFGSDRLDRRGVEVCQLEASIFERSRMS
jgi:putative spermidine/putrescine transport system permease protein